MAVRHSEQHLAKSGKLPLSTETWRGRFIMLIRLARTRNLRILFRDSTVSGVHGTSTRNYRYRCCLFFRRLSFIVVFLACSFVNTIAILPIAAGNIRCRRQFLPLEHTKPRENNTRVPQERAEVVEMREASSRKWRQQANAHGSQQQALIVR